MIRPGALALLLSVVSCGSDEASTAGAQTDGGVASGSATDHIVGAGAKTYAEKSESSNACGVTPEDTAYTVDEAGIVISGALEAASPSSDCFAFKSGAASYVVVRAFVNGAASALPGVKCSGFSSSVVAPDTGRAPVTPNLTCTVSLFPKPSDAGGSYTIELAASK